MKAVHVVLGADLRAGHEGLIIQAKVHDIHVEYLEPGEAVVFINAMRDKLKAYSYNGVLTYVKFDEKRRGIDMDALNEIPRAFNPDGTLDYNAALRAALEKKLSKRGKFEMEAI